MRVLILGSDTVASTKIAINTVLEGRCCSYKVITSYQKVKKQYEANKVVASKINGPVKLSKEITEDEKIDINKGLIIDGCISQSIFDNKQISECLERGQHVVWCCTSPDSYVFKKLKFNRIYITKTVSQKLLNPYYREYVDHDKVRIEIFRTLARDNDILSISGSGGTVEPHSVAQPLDQQPRVQQSATSTTVAESKRRSDQDCPVFNSSAVLEPDCVRLWMRLYPMKGVTKVQVAKEMAGMLGGDIIKLMYTKSDVGNLEKVVEIYFHVKKVRQDMFAGLAISMIRALRNKHVECGYIGC